MPRTNIYTRACNYAFPYLKGDHLNGLDKATATAIKKAYEQASNDAYKAGDNRESQLLASIAESMQLLENRIDRQGKLNLTQEQDR